MLLKPWASEESPLRTKIDLCLGFRVLGRLNLIWVHKAVTRSHVVLEILCPGIWRVPFLYNCKFVCRFWGNRNACTAIWGECACPQINTDLTISYDFFKLLIILFYFILRQEAKKPRLIKLEPRQRAHLEGRRDPSSASHRHVTSHMILACYIMCCWVLVSEHEVEPGFN